VTAPQPVWFALVESNTTGTGQLFCARARVHSLRPVVLTSDPSRYPYLTQDDIDVLVVDTGSLDDVHEACRRLAVEGLAGVTSSSEYFAGSAAAVAGKLGLPGPDPDAIERCRNKESQRAALAAAGVAAPRSRGVSTVDSARQAAEELGWPIVLKPTTGSGSVGVRLCRDLAEVQAAAADLLRDTVNERGMPAPRRALVEEHVNGAEYSVETFDGAVVGITRKYLGPAPFFVETGHDFPASLLEDERRALEATTIAALTALNLGWGAAHTELRMSQHGPAVIEVNPRLAGGMIPTLVGLVCGIDLVDAVIVRASGRKPTLRATTLDKHAAIRFVLAPGSGTVGSVEGLAEARESTGVRLAELTVAPGHEHELTNSFRDRLGYVIAVGADQPTTTAAAERARDLIRVRLRSATETSTGAPHDRAAQRHLHPADAPDAGGDDDGRTGRRRLWRGPDCRQAGDQGGRADGAAGGVFRAQRDDGESVRHPRTGGPRPGGDRG